MKKMILNLVLFAVCGLFTTFLTAQDTLVVPSMIDGEVYGILNQVIEGDTTDTGERMNLARVYKLNLGETYYLSGAIYANYDLTIVADTPTDALKPPVITSGVAQNGQVVGADFFVLSGNVKMQNIYIMGTPPTNLGQINRVYHIQGNDTEIIFDGVTFEWGQWICIGVFAENTSVNIQNCYFKNCENTSDVWNGRPLDLRDNPTKKLIFMNNTLFNVNSFMVRGEANIIDYAVIEHNTIVNSLKWPIQWRYQTNVRIANNLFYNSHSYGENEDDKVNQDKDGLDFGIFNLEVIPPDVIPDGTTEADRLIDFSNNAWFYSQKVKDYWNEYGLVDEPLMNSRTKAFFSNNGDYPKIIEANTYNEDPVFINLGDSEDKLVTFMGKKRNNKGSRPWGFDADNNRHSIVWPEVENLGYTNSTLITGGDDGFPVGDINNFPEKKKEWDKIVANGDLQITPNFILHPNSPNPFSNHTTISYSVSKPSIIKIQLFDINGRLVKTIKNDFDSIGEHSITINSKDIGNISGIYFYKLSSNRFTAIGKMSFIN